MARWMRVGEAVLSSRRGRGVNEAVLAGRNGLRRGAFFGVVYKNLKNENIKQTLLHNTHLHEAVWWLMQRPAVREQAERSMRPKALGARTRAVAQADPILPASPGIN